MKILVNNTMLELHEGAKVKDAIRKYYTQTGQKITDALPDVEDRYGNIVDPDGELSEGNTLIIKN
jgi:hypothetical protein